MAMEITNHYNSIYKSIYTTPKQQKTKNGETEEAAEAQKTSGMTSKNTDYLNKLQKKVPSMILREGNYIPTSEDKRVGTLTLHPDILAQMQSDPQKEEYYTQRMKDIAGAEKMARAFSSSIGFTTVYSHWYIDKEGKIWHTAMTVRKDKLNEKLRKEAEENAKKQIEKTRENARQKAEKLFEQLEEKAQDAEEKEKKREQASHNEDEFGTVKEQAEKLIREKIENAKDGELLFDDSDIKTLLDAAKEEENGKGDTKKSVKSGANFDMQI